MLMLLFNDLQIASLPPRFEDANYEENGKEGTWGIFNFLSHKGDCLLMLTENTLGVSYLRSLGLEGNLEFILFSSFQPFILIVLKPIFKVSQMKKYKADRSQTAR